MENWYLQVQPAITIIMRKAIPAEIMKKGTPVVAMKTDIPVAAAAEVVEDIPLLPEEMWERPVVHITGEPLMMERSSTPPMTVGNRWNLPAEPVR